MLSPGKAAFRVESVSAGPFVTVLSVAGRVEAAARPELEHRLEDPQLMSTRVVVDVTEAALYDSWPLALLARSAERFRERGGELVLVNDGNATTEPFVGDGSFPGLRWFASLEDAMVELLADVTRLSDWPPTRPNEA